MQIQSFVDGFHNCSTSVHTKHTRKKAFSVFFFLFESRKRKENEIERKRIRDERRKEKQKRT
jgi:hypothetical protein